MTLPEIKSDEVRVWLEKAAHDIEAAEVDRRAANDTSPDFLWDVMFHCQQSAEKSFKGFLTWHDIKFRWTHDLAEIGSQCIVADPTLAPIAREAEPLSQYAWEFRYPGESEDPTENQAREALQLARKVFQEILIRLPKETHPLTSNKLIQKIKNSRATKKKSSGSRKK